MADLLSLLLTNPHGIDNSPLKYGQSVGEIRNADDPYYGTGGPSMPASLAYMLSGIPMAKEGIEGAREASLAGDPVRTAGNVAETALAALPFSKAATATAPRLASVLAGSYLAPGFASGELSLGATPAEAKTRKRVAPVREEAPPVETAPVDNGLSPAENAEMAKLQRRIQNANWSSGAERRSLESRLQQLQGVSADYAKSKNSAVTEAARIKATSEAQIEAEKAKAAQESADREAAANEPFKKAHPYISAAIPAATTLASVLLGSRMGYGNRKVFQEGMDELSTNIGNLGRSAETAFKKGDTLTASRLTQESQALKGQLDDIVKKGEAGSMGTVLGASALGDIGLAAPTFIDKARALPGSDLEKETNAQLALTPENLQTWGGRMALGAFMHGALAKGGVVGGQALHGPVKVPIGADAKATSLSALLKEGGTSEATAAQRALADYGQARQDAANKTRQLESGSALVRGDADAGSVSPVPVAESSPSPPSLSSQLSHNGWETQVRNPDGKFGRKQKPKNDN